MGLEAETKLNVVVVRYPASNCDFDTLRFFRRAGHNAEFLWHKETKTPNADLLFIPGGFAFGDREYERATGEFTIDPGAQALRSPVMKVIDQWANDQRLIIGVCNGFQILTHADLLPGKLLQNKSEHFFCDDVDVTVEGRSFLGKQDMLGNTYRINVAHGYGRYFTTLQEYKELARSGQIFLRYQGFNPNGSFEDIAGVCNKEGNIWGMMPHPERTDPVTRQIFMGAIENYVRTS